MAVTSSIGKHGSLTLSLSIEPGAMAEVRSMFAGMTQDMARSLARAVDATTNAVFARAKREVHEATGLKPGIIGKMIAKYKARVESNGSIRSRVWLGGRDVPMIKLGARQVNPRGKKQFRLGRGEGGGVQYNSPDSRGRTFVPHAFISEMPSKHVGVFLRATKDRRDTYHPGARRLPIQEQKLKSPIAGVYSGNRARLAALIGFGHRKLNEQIVRQAKLVTGRIKPRMRRKVA